MDQPLGGRAIKIPEIRSARENLDGKQARMSYPGGERSISELRGVSASLGRAGFAASEPETLREMTGREIKGVLFLQLLEANRNAPPFQHGFGLRGGSGTLGWM